MQRFISALILILSVFSAVAQNYDEQKVPAYVLPDVLRTKSGKASKSKADWEKRRRPEVLALFSENVYGRSPERYDSIRYSVTNVAEEAMGGKALQKRVVIEVFRKGQSISINLTLFVPAYRRGVAPVFLLINNRSKDLTDPTRKVKSEFWPAELVIEHGYAVAAFHVSDLAPDNKDHFQDGVLRLYPELLSAPDGMKAIGAWAWGASRVMDYFQTEEDVDSKRVIVVGHSRGGKASLWATAQDPRFAMCISNCSGNTGAALARRQFGERITRINTTFPYWFSDNYKKYNDKENTLPVDQHMLVALVAPRPVYATNASKDLWADPKGTFLALKNAEPVYRLYDQHSGLPRVQPGIDDPIIRSPLGYHNHEGIHDMTGYDWTQFIRFADYHFGLQKK